MVELLTLEKVRHLPDLARFELVAREEEEFEGEQATVARAADVGLELILLS